jgi:hypothetical protein
MQILSRNILLPIALVLGVAVAPLVSAHANGAPCVAAPGVSGNGCLPAPQLPPIASLPGTTIPVDQDKDAHTDYQHQATAAPQVPATPQPSVEVVVVPLPIASVAAAPPPPPPIISEATQNNDPEEKKVAALSAQGFSVTTNFLPNQCSVVLTGNEEQMATGIQHWLPGQTISWHDQMVMLDRILYMLVMYADASYQRAPNLGQCHFTGVETIGTAPGGVQNMVIATFNFDHKTWSRIDWSKASFADVLKVAPNYAPSPYALAVAARAGIK